MGETRFHQEDRSMVCELCAFEATLYGQPLRVFEDARICLGCYLDVHGASWERRRAYEPAFLRLSPASASASVAA
jgi:hypothetical protein